MKKTLFSLGIAAVAIFVTTAVVAGISSAHIGDDEGLGKLGDKKEQYKEVIENNDFDSWKEQMSDKGMDEALITEENFQKMIEIHNLLKAGDKDAVMELKKELGDLGFGAREGMRVPKIDTKAREQIRAAVEAGDYNAWKELVGERADEVTEDEFPRLQEAYQLMSLSRENMEGAREIHEEIGLKMGGFEKSMKKHPGMMR